MKMSNQLSLFDEQVEYKGIPIHLPDISFKKTKKCHNQEVTVHYKDKPLFHLRLENIADCEFGNLNYDVRSLDNDSGKGFIDYKEYVEEVLNEDIRVAIIKEVTE